MPTTFAGVRYLSTEETATLLNLKPATLRARRARGREAVRSVKVGSAVLYRSADVERMAGDGVPVGSGL